MAELHETFIKNAARLLADANDLVASAYVILDPEAPLLEHAETWRARAAFWAYLFEQHSKAALALADDSPLAQELNSIWLS